MGDKIRGTIAVIFGVLGVLEGFVLYHEGYRGARLGVAALGVVVIAFGIWRIRRKPVDPTAELLK